MPKKPYDKKLKRHEFGHRQTREDPLTPTPETGFMPFLAKRSTAVGLVLVSGVAFLAYSTSFRRACPVPAVGASSEVMADYERCRARHSSSSTRSSYSSSSGGASGSSATSHSTASRGGFGSMGAGHASGG